MSSPKCVRAIYMNEGLTLYKPLLSTCDGLDFMGPHGWGFFPIDIALLFALVECWRPETHTFHMPISEYTITLQDVAIQLALPIYCRPVLGRINLDWAQMCA